MATFVVACCREVMEGFTARDAKRTKGKKQKRMSFVSLGDLRGLQIFAVKSIMVCEQRIRHRPLKLAQAGLATVARGFSRRAD